MFGIFSPHHILEDNKYLKDLVNTTSGTAVMCYDQQCQEGEECCHTMDYGIAYCCSQMSGLMYLSVMVGGGFIIALLVICCYVFMRGKEKQLEAAAQLEAAKAVSTAMSSAHEAIQLAGEANAHSTEDFNAPPPSYGEVVQTLQRCHSYDVGVTSNASQDNDVTLSIGRQLSESSNVSYSIATASALPPLPPCNTLDSKLPTYEQCTSAADEINTSSNVQTSTRLFHKSVQPGDESSGISSTSKCYFSSTCGVTNVTTPETETDELPLSTPTQVDDDTGIVQPRLAASDDTRLVIDSEDRLVSDNSNSSVRCRLEFRWNANDHTEIAIGYKNCADDNSDESTSDFTNRDGAGVERNEPCTGLNVDQSEKCSSCEAVTAGHSSDMNTHKTDGEKEEDAQSCEIEKHSIESDAGGSVEEGVDDNKRGDYCK